MHGGRLPLPKKRHEELDRALQHRSKTVPAQVLVLRRPRLLHPERRHVLLRLHGGKAALYCLELACTGEFQEGASIKKVWAKLEAQLATLVGWWLGDIVEEDCLRARLPI